MKSIRIAASRGYDVLIGKGLLSEAGQLVAQRSPRCSALLIADDTVAPLYADAAAASFERAGFRVLRFAFPHGEESKSIAILSDILEYAAKERLTRSDLFIALGGGVTGDLVGLAAALYQRGVPFVQIPTTFLAAIDSSVGGKTAVNLAAGKNLAGAFWQPMLVVCDTDAFSTLPADIFADGMAEALKYGIIFDGELFAALESGLSAASVPEDILARCVELKRDVVQNDEFDRGERQLLNFGHTLGHAVERCSGYAVAHGHAVAAGMAIVTRACERLGLCKNPFSDRLSAALARCGLPDRCGYTAEGLAEAALSDKKRSGATVTLVVPERLGRCVLYAMPADALAAFIAAGIK